MKGNYEKGINAYISRDGAREDSQAFIYDADVSESSDLTFIGSGNSNYADVVLAGTVQGRGELNLRAKKASSSLAEVSVYVRRTANVAVPIVLGGSKGLVYNDGTLGSLTLETSE